MQVSDLPVLVPIPFAENGTKNTIPSAPSPTPGEASLDLGFPPETMIPLVAGGVPPLGADVNGILNLLSQTVRWTNAGCGFGYSSTFATAIGGYPKGAVLLNAAADGFWLSTADNNSANPDTGGANWVPAFNQGVTAIAGLTNANVTLTTTQYAKPTILLSGTLTGNIQIILPNTAQHWVVANGTSGNFTVTCKTAAGTGVAIQQGAAAQVYGDGTNIAAVAGPLATETVQGSAKIATQAQTNAGTDDTTIVTPKKLRAGFAISLGVTGYIAFPTWLGGLIFQWTSVLSNSNGFAPWTYPIAFPSGAFVAYHTAGVNSGNNNMTATLIGTPGSTNTNASVFVNGVQSSTAGQVNVKYLVIGN